MLKLIHNSKAISYFLMVLLFMQGVPLSSAFAREDNPVQNVRFEISGTKILILYDLQGPASEGYIVKVTLRRTSNTTFAYIPKVVLGDIGEGKPGGNNKQIVWEILREFPQGLEGDDFYFVVTADVVSSGSNAWLWIGGGAALVGGAAYFLLKGKEQTGDTGGFPQPIGRPSGN